MFSTTEIPGNLLDNGAGEEKVEAEKNYSVVIPTNLEAASTWRNSGGIEARWRDVHYLRIRTKKSRSLTCGLILLLSCLVLMYLRGPFISSIISGNKIRKGYGFDSLFRSPELSQSILIPSPAFKKNDSSLVPFTLHPLPLGSIKARGWLHDQLRLMAEGMAGHEFDFYPIVQSNPWLGGTAEYSSLNEGFPYWFNGLVPLAYALDDVRLKAQIRNATQYVLAHQQASGWLGPEVVHDSSTLWARFPFFLGLMQLVEADSDFAPQVIPAMHKFVNLMHSLLLDGKNTSEVWGRARYADMILSLQWLYETYPENNAEVLIETMQRLKDHGLDWAGYYTEQNYIFDDLDTVSNTAGDFSFVHAVNAAQGLKTGAVDYRFTRNTTLLQSSRNGVKWTFQFHGAASGTILGDERESGLSPTRGSELCTAVEAMFSMSYLYQVLGDNAFADQCELAAFNALPVAMTPNHWAHQYITQPNQPWSRPVQASGLFWNVGNHAQTYGLSPNYPCCTVNHPQGYPKFLSASFVRIGRSGLGHALLSPASVSTTLLDGTLVTARCDTNYPFGHTLNYTIESTNPFTFHIRLPTWGLPTPPIVSLNDSPYGPQLPNAHSGMLAVPLARGSNTLILTLNPTLRIAPRANATIAIYHGPLLYALDVGEAITALPPSMAALTRASPSSPPTINSFPLNPTPNTTFPHQAHDYLINNTLPWAIALDPDTLLFHASNTSTSSSPTTSSLPNPIWAYRAPASFITAQGCPIAWPLDHGVPARVPLVGERNCTGPWREVVLRPYGSLRVHMAELPVLRRGNATGAGRGDGDGAPGKGGSAMG
ncbi:hypothetical protein MMC18_001004 [Xylographa bjoerkii]|nr:hypothetical protein [Xylographa bjoerkii]